MESSSTSIQESNFWSGKRGALQDRTLRRKEAVDSGEWTVLAFINHRTIPEQALVGVDQVPLRDELITGRTKWSDASFCTRTNTLPALYPLVLLEIVGDLADDWVE